MSQTNPNFLGFPDPFAPAYGAAGGWASQLQNATTDLYLSLLMLEVIILAVQSLFFKDSVIEYIKNFAGKILLATAVIAVIARANLIFPQAVSLFADTAGAVIGAPGVSAQAQGGGCAQGYRWTCVPSGPPGSGDVEGTFLEWATFYFMAADLSRVADSVEAIASSIMFGIPFPPDPGNGDPAISTTFLMGHGQFQMVCFGLGMLCVLSAASVYLTYILLTFETQIVIAIGVITMAGFGSRFTKSLAVGFPKYIVTIGSKWFAFYFTVATVQVMVDTVNNSFTGTGGLLLGLISGAVVPFGLFAVALVVSCSTAPIITVLSAVMIASIPNFAASLTQGGSAFSAGKASTQISKAFTSG